MLHEDSKNQPTNSIFGTIINTVYNSIKQAVNSIYDKFYGNNTQESQKIDLTVQQLKATNPHIYAIMLNDRFRGIIKEQQDITLSSVSYLHMAVLLLQLYNDRSNYRDAQIMDKYYGPEVQKLDVSRNVTAEDKENLFKVLYEETKRFLEENKETGHIDRKTFTAAFNGRLKTAIEQGKQTVYNQFPTDESTSKVDRDFSFIPGDQFGPQKNIIDTDSAKDVTVDNINMRGQGFRLMDNIRETMLNYASESIDRIYENGASVYIDTNPSFSNNTNDHDSFNPLFTGQQFATRVHESSPTNVKTTPLSLLQNQQNETNDTTVKDLNHNFPRRNRQPLPDGRIGEEEQMDIGQSSTITSSNRPSKRSYTDANEINMDTEYSTDHALVVIKYVDGDMKMQITTNDRVIDIYGEEKREIFSYIAKIKVIEENNRQEYEVKRAKKFKDSLTLIGGAEALPADYLKNRTDLNQILAKYTEEDVAVEKRSANIGGIVGEINKAIRSTQSELNKQTSDNLVNVAGRVSNAIHANYGNTTQTRGLKRDLAGTIKSGQYASTTETRQLLDWGLSRNPNSNSFSTRIRQVVMQYAENNPNSDKTIALLDALSSNILLFGTNVRIEFSNKKSDQSYDIDVKYEKKLVLHK